MIPTGQHNIHFPAQIEVTGCQVVAGECGGTARSFYTTAELQGGFLRPVRRKLGWLSTVGRLKAVLATVVLTSACTSVSAVSPSPAGEPAQGVLSVVAAPAIPTPVVVAPVAPVVSPPAVAPCSVMLPPAPGVSRLLLCVTSDQGSRAVEAAEITYAGAFIGTTDHNGQFLLRLRGYGGVQSLVVYHAAYSRSPVHLDLALTEEHVTESVDLGTLR